MENNLTMQELLDMQEQELSKINVGDRISGSIAKITNDELYLKLPVGFDGVVPESEASLKKGEKLSDIYKEGEEIEGVITNVSYKDASIKISIARLRQQSELEELSKAMEEGAKIVVHVVKALDRGLYVQYKSQNLFMPISQIDTKFVKDTKEYLGKDLECYIKEINHKKNRVIVSHRDVAQEVLDAQRKERREKEKAERERRKAERERIKAEREAFFNSLNVGDRLDGKVTSVMPYGAFIDIGGIEGLAHINNLAWKRVESVEDVVSEGDSVVAFIQGIDEESKKISLSLKNPDEDPWRLAADEYGVGSVVSAKVLRIIDKGAFVQVKEGLEAYIPLGEMSEDHIKRVEDVVNIGDVVTAKIIKFNAANKRMMLSIKELTKEPEEDFTQYMSVGDDAIGTIGEVLKEKNEI